MRQSSELYKITVITSMLAVAVVFTWLFLVVFRTDIVYTHLFYIPIMLSAIWWGWPALLTVVILVVQLMIVHYIAKGNFNFIWHDMMRSLMFFVVSVFACSLSVRLKRSRDDIERACRESEERVRQRTRDLEDKNELLSREISIRKKAEKEMDLFRIVADSSSQGFGMADFNGNIVYANRSLLVIFGEDSPASVLNKSIFEYYPEKLHKRVREETLPYVLKGGNWQGESEIVSKKGRVSVVLENIFIIKDEQGKSKYFANIVNDITERKKIESEMKEKMSELEAFTRFAVDRELRMAELENKIRKLESRIEGAK